MVTVALKRESRYRRVWAVGGLVVWMHDGAQIRLFCVDVASILSRLMAI